MQKYLSRDYKKYPLKKYLTESRVWKLERPCKEDLITLYIEQNLSRQEICDYFACTPKMLSRWTHEFNIHKSKKQQNVCRARMLCDKCYPKPTGLPNDKRYDLYRKLNVDITHLTRDYVQYPLKYKEICNKEDLLYLYIDLNLSQHAIGLLTGSFTVVKNSLKHHNIQKEQCKLIQQRKAACFKKYGGPAPACSKIIRKKQENTMRKRYGVSNIAQSPYFKKKYKQVMNDKYGVDNYFQTQECKEKTHATFIKKYGTPYYCQTEECKSKARKTSLVKYGETSYTKTKQYREFLSKNASIFQKKIYDTKKKNNTFTTSKQEKKVLDLLVNKFPDTKYHYSSEKYPFTCDFYIPSLDLYIEYQGTWTHGAKNCREPFNKNNKRHQQQLTLWTKKAAELNFKGKKKNAYLDAIETWTKRDPQKRKLAKKNKLNWMEFWSIEEVVCWLNQFNNNKTLGEKKCIR